MNFNISQNFHNILPDPLDCMIDIPSLIKQKKHKLRQKSKDAGLKLLTKKFIKFVRQSNHNIINLKEVQQSLKVTKRRIYDITNVIEGIFL